jgi:PAT family beta-lactamase induction signal transducer AmpG
MAVLYLSSGFPFGLVNDAAPVLYKASGVDLAAVGVLSLVGLPWTFKFLWAPLVDRLGSRRRWVVGCQVALAGLLVALSTLPSDEVTPVAWWVLVGLALASATQDVAADGYAVEAVPPGEVGPANSVRITAYRIALILAGGTLVARSETLGWSGAWLAAAAVMGAFAAATWFAPAVPASRPASADVAEPLRRLAGRPEFLAVALFVLLFKAGDYAMAPMTKPLLLDRGFTKVEIGDYVTPLAVVATIVGAVAGGALTRRLGTFHALWSLGLLQAVSNLAYAAAADAGGKEALWVAAGIEPFCGGLGTAPFLSFLMLSCERRHAATQFALLTALMGLGRTLAGTWSGFGAERLGYGPYFALTFALAIPAFLLLGPVKRWLGDAGRAPPR